MFDYEHEFIKAFGLDKKPDRKCCVCGQEYQVMYHTYKYFLEHYCCLRCYPKFVR